MLMNLNAVFSPVNAVASTQAILFHNIVKKTNQKQVDCSGVKFSCQIFAFNDFSAICTRPGSHLTKARANSGKSQFINHGIKPSFGSTINSTSAVLLQSTNISCELASPPPFYLGLL